MTLPADKGGCKGNIPYTLHALFTVYVFILSHTLVKTLTDGVQELCGINRMRFYPLHKVNKVFSHDTLIESVEAGILKLVGIVYQFGKVVKLTTLMERAAPCKDCRHRVG